jgi:hypothetical protein
VHPAVNGWANIYRADGADFDEAVSEVFEYHTGRMVLQLAREALLRRVKFKVAHHPDW